MGHCTRRGLRIDGRRLDGAFVFVRRPKPRQRRPARRRRIDIRRRRRRDTPPDRCTSSAPHTGATAPIGPIPAAAATRSTAAATSTPAATTAAPEAAASATSTAAATTATASAATAATTAAASGELNIGSECCGVFFVEDEKRRQAYVRDFLLGQNDLVRRRPGRGAARQRQRQSGGCPECGYGFLKTPALRGLLGVRHGREPFP
jgi:hypothetical protein